VVRRLPIAADVAVDIETFIYAVAVAAVFVVVSIIDFTPIVEPEGVSRVDLQRISSALGDQMTRRAQELRESGALTSPVAARQGRTL
jgi:hypothetical protein